MAFQTTEARQLCLDLSGQQGGGSSDSRISGNQKSIPNSLNPGTPCQRGIRGGANPAKDLVLYGKTFSRDKVAKWIGISKRALCGRLLDGAAAGLTEEQVVTRAALQYGKVRKPQQQLTQQQQPKTQN